MSATLNDLERKLHDLERELAGASGAVGPVAPESAPPAVMVPPAAPTPAPAPASAPAPARLVDPEAQRLIAEAKASLGGLHHQLDDLVRVREELERSTRELMEEYGRVLSTFGTTAEQTAAPAPPAAAPDPTPRAAPVPPASDGTVFSGPVTVDAGPFTDIATLSAFEQALGQVPGTQDVYVRGFEGSRALIDVVLGDSVALGSELRRTAPVGFSLVTTGPQHVSITIDGGRHA